MKILSSNPHGPDKASVLQYASAIREDHLANFMIYWRNHRSVTKLRVIEKNKCGSNALFHVGLKSDGGWVTKIILDNNAFFSTGIPVVDGIERWSVLVAEENKTSLLSELDRVGVVRINSLQKLQFSKEDQLHDSDITSKLSAKQFRILKTAVELGYFDCPRRIDSRQLAKQMGIAQSTLLEHLRKSQLKILGRALGHTSE